jgi:hypothetical protein
MAITNDPRHVRLRLQPETVGTLLRWQSAVVGAGEAKPTYSEMIDALVDHADPGVVIAILLEQSRMAYEPRLATANER